MSKKRFVCIDVGYGDDWYITDNGKRLSEMEIVDLLNEQQEHITHLEDTNDNFRIKLIEDIEAMEQAEKKIGEQQATISALKEENEQLRENLHNCRLNKNIIREKLKLWQDAHKEYKIYSIKDFEELLNGLKKENEQLRLELDTHKHPLWSTREAERKLSEVTDNLADEVKKNGLLNEELNQLRIENMRLKKRW